MTKFLLAAETIWFGVRESLLSWIILIFVILVMLLICRCFTSPMKLARKRLRTMQEKISDILPSRKNKKELEEDVPLQKIRDLSKESTACQRLVNAYWYDHGEDMKVKNALTIMKKIQGGIDAAKR